MLDAGVLRQHRSVGDVDFFDSSFKIQFSRPQVRIERILGEGHKVSPSFFECRELFDFVLTQLPPVSE